MVFWPSGGLVFVSVICFHLCFLAYLLDKPFALLYFPFQMISIKFLITVQKKNFLLDVLSVLWQRRSYLLFHGVVVLMVDFDGG